MLQVLTKYDELQNVIPNLVVNDVLELYDAAGEENNNEKGEETEKQDDDGSNITDEAKCENISKTMKGSLLRQTGGAKVAGINFSAKTTLEVREWPYGMPDYAHADTIETLSELQPQQKPEQTKLVRYKFPRPFAVSNLPTRDISMQSIENDDGEFRMYQGVWRMVRFCLLFLLTCCRVQCVTIVETKAKPSTLLLLHARRRSRLSSYYLLLLLLCYRR